MDLGIKGRVALITGGNKGIGLSSAVEMAKEGVNLFITGRNEKDNKLAEEKIAAHGVEVHSIPADIESADGVKKVVEAAYDAFGKIDILFNNAGYSHPCTPISATDEEWMGQFNVHVMSCVRTCSLIIPKMIEQKWGRIINMSSMYGISPGIGVPDYDACKAAVLNYTRSLGMEYSKYGICSTAICPGLIHTEIWDRFADNFGAEIGKTRAEILASAADYASSTKRFAEPDEVGKVVAFLASECASFITGCAVQVDGGALAGVEINW